MKPKFKIMANTLIEGNYGIGIGLYHYLGETYINIDFLKWTIAIGMMG